MEATTVARIIVNKIFYKYNFFKHLASDLGSNFMSKLVKAICDIFGMKKVSSSSYAPMSQGSIENHNKFIHASLRKLLNTKKNWNDYLAPIQYTYNSTISKGHDFSPSFLYFCHEPSSMFDLNLDIPLDTVNFNSRYNLQEFINQALYARQIAKSNIVESQAEMKQYFDKKAKNIKYEVNDIVLLHNTRNTYDLPRKLSQNFLGPFYIQ